MEKKEISLLVPYVHGGLYAIFNYVIIYLYLPLSLFIAVLWTVCPCSAAMRR